MQYKLTKEIIDLSESNEWNNAKNEWQFETVYQNEELQHCLCGHYPIKNVCVIRNIQNNNETEVGNCCVNKFLGIEEGNKLFTAIKKLKTDDSKSMGIDVLDFLNDKGILNEFEYTFYVDTVRKRKLSEKQEAIRRRINQKFLNITSIDSSTALAKLNQVLAWSEKNKWFNVSFINSLKSNYDRSGKLTEKQISALDNIINKNKIK